MSLIVKLAGCCPSVYNGLTSAALYMHVNDSVTTVGDLLSGELKVHERLPEEHRAKEGDLVQECSCALV